MSSLADLPELVGFFSYARSDDENSDKALSLLRKRIRGELQMQLGRKLRLWQDTEAIPFGALWEGEIKRAIAESAFFIPIVTPSAVNSPYCRMEFEAFLARESELWRDDLVFPVLYVRVPALANADQRSRDEVLKIIHARQYADWTEIRLDDVASPHVGKQIARLCEDIVEALHKTRESLEERQRKREEAEAQRRADEENQRNEEAEALQRAEKERQGREEAELLQAVEERQRTEQAEAQRRANEARHAVIKAIFHAEAERRPREEAELPRHTTEEPGSHIKDHPFGPEMVVVPAGRFFMSSRRDKDVRAPSRGGLSTRRVRLDPVTIERPFAVGRFAVTFDEWDAAVAAKGVKYTPDDAGWGRGRRPVINVSWEDAQVYAGWLSQETGKTYRLLSEAEWEYCCLEGGAVTTFGDTINEKHGQFSQRKTVEVGSFSPNSWGLHEMGGNVWEWCNDNWHPPTFEGARVLRGGSWDDVRPALGSADCNWLPSNLRLEEPPDVRRNNIGFRVARTL